MAHACDYQSRILPIPSKYQRLQNQLENVFISYKDKDKDWLWRYCFLLYEGMGLTREIFDKLYNGRKQ